MTPIGRRRFCAALGAGIAGLAVLASAGCSSTDDDPLSAPAGPDLILAGLSLQVRSDPG